MREDPLVANGCVDWQVNGWIADVGDLELVVDALDDARRALNRNRAEEIFKALGVQLCEALVATLVLAARLEPAVFVDAAVPGPRRAAALGR